MAALRPIVREPRSTSERSEAEVFAIHNALVPVGPTAHPGLLFTTEGAGVQIKGQLRGGFFNPPSNKKYK